MHSTKKLYFQYPYKPSCKAIVEEINHEKSSIRLDQTVAFPEGGGQASDSGIFLTEEGTSIPFINVYKLPGRLLLLNDFPTITVDNPIYHTIPQDFLESIKVGMLIELKIDIIKRASTALYHSAAHLVIIGTGKVRPDAVEAIKGCSIKSDGARFDFSVKHRFTEEDISKISKIANEFVGNQFAIEVFPHPDEPEAWYWKCEDIVIPCGGTHIPNTGIIGNINLKRRRMAKDLERLILRIPDIQIPTYLYENN